MSTSTRGQPAPESFHGIARAGRLASAILDRIAHIRAPAYWPAWRGSASRRCGCDSA